MTHKHVIMIESSITVDSGVFQSIEVKDSRVVDPSFAKTMSWRLEFIHAS